MVVAVPVSITESAANSNKTLQGGFAPFQILQGDDVPWICSYKTERWSAETITDVKTGESHEIVAYWLQVADRLW